MIKSRMLSSTAVVRAREKCMQGKAFFGAGSRLCLFLFSNNYGLTTGTGQAG
jgi:hypothetical protein